MYVFNWIQFLEFYLQWKWLVAWFLLFTALVDGLRLLYAVVARVLMDQFRRSSDNLFATKVQRLVLEFLV